MDFANYETKTNAEKGVEMVVINPSNGEKTDAKIRLNGRDSSAFRNAMKAQAQKAMEASKRKDEPAGADDYEVETCKTLAACTISWEGVVEDGKAVEFSKEAAASLYLKYGWLRDQVDRFIGDRTNFFPKSKKA